ncbi:CPBP family intramembrane metalloprotease [Clostridium tagluense]|uniref:CPBP family intramembrane glutamic endopeptidase n=1 Tax=Clostridium tagluense TaxID=360422 RepID=UPI001CF2DC01|nr:type II CAAX endopeptidase family protein [Clostridium tagluense]MCB2312865.1 CPBP family intramembrane metalloprotease [Clostridium tagluense]MCB2317631.1 CPBP family intramembrane metalloprotease [Clostridium tagluense]MCB2322412.1 CPBP family intramembrane metalloprotease [Clostridium tagluense]MCB2327415.1 CPBP family intramembrane metalloprotease [Clostridium tagluense]MCB2332133.1 CPBP family intramembrane metalloprotease [Clostridium tagluense]
MSITKAFLVMLLALLLESLGQIPIGILNLFFKQYTNIAPYISFAAGVLVYYFTIILLLKWYSKDSCEQPRKKSLNIKNFIYVALTIIAFRLAYDNSLIYLIDKIPMPDFINQAFEELAISPIILILSVAVIAPIYEEVIFRGILLKGMANKINPTVALVVSALFFALMHGNIPQGINAFLIGLIIGAIYLNTGSIYLCIFSHFINNFVVITISGAFQSIDSKYAILIHGTAFIVGISILIAAYGWYMRNKPGDVLAIHKEYIEV